MRGRWDWLKIGEGKSKKPLRRRRENLEVLLCGGCFGRNCVRKRTGEVFGRLKKRSEGGEEKVKFRRG